MKQPTLEEALAHFDLLLQEWRTLAIVPIKSGDEIRRVKALSGDMDHLRECFPGHNFPAIALKHVR